MNINKSGKNIAFTYLGREEIVAALIQFGANINHVDNNGETALFLNAVYGNRDQFFKQNILFHFPFEKYYKGNEKIATLLLANGADVNSATKNGLTPLHLAARLSNS